jgi:hypothetical protein
MAERKDQEVTGHQSDLRPDVHRIRFGGFEFSIPTIAFGLKLIGILLPTAKFSLDLKEPSPPQLLIAICIALFSAVVFLWILDATSLLRFRAEWVGKSIYGAAIASVLGTSVAVYKDAFSERKYPYEGRWEVQIRKDGQLIANNQLIMMYSDSAETYWGFSDFKPSQQALDIVARWVRVNDFDNKSGKINLSYLDNEGREEIIAMSLISKRNGELFTSDHSLKSDEDPKSKVLIEIGRPK